MENANYNQHNGSGGSGFIIGVIVGVILTLLLTTKRGRVILKELLEKGIEKFSNLEDFMQEATKRADTQKLMMILIVMMILFQQHRYKNRATKSKKSGNHR